MGSIRRICVNLSAERQYHREVWGGIIQYMQVNKPWMLDGEPTSPLATLADLPQPFPDGVIMMRSSAQELTFLNNAKVPFVSLSYGTEDVARVVIDPDAIGQLAFQHFLERGFRHFAFCGLSEMSHFRGDPFAAAVARGGYQCHRFDVSYRQRYHWIDGRDRERLTDWLLSLPKPVGVFGMNDVRGRHIINACIRAGISVPDEVAVLGVDNEMPHCELSHPALSSVMSNAFHVGFEAATMLDQLIAGKTLDRRNVFIPPTGIATRQSSDIAAASDPIVGKAVRFIRTRACEGIDVADVLAHVVVSRTWLDMRFREMLGRTPHDEILRVKLERSRELLRQSSFSIDLIAERAGFRHAAYLGAVFQKKYGQTPGQYRAQISATGQ